MPDGSPVPAGCIHDGYRLVRKRKGSRRPPDTPLDFWKMLTPREKEADNKRYEDLLGRIEEAKRLRRVAESPAMPVQGATEEASNKFGLASMKERKKEIQRSWLEDRLEDALYEAFGLVARSVSQAEVDRTPAAKKAMDAEWENLRSKTAWLEEQVREFDDVSGEPSKNQKKVHFGRIFEMCTEKGSELPDGDPNKKWKGRSVFQGNRMHDEYHDHALFAELGSSPASMESGKILDAYGSEPGFSNQQADARQAYTQALFEGITTWVRIPRNRWPASWSKYRDPVCPISFVWTSRCL